MVSGFVTSPYDQLRISSGEAIFSWMKSKSLERGSRVLGKSIIYSLLLSSERDGQTERLQFLHEHVEGLGNAGLRQVLPLHDRLVDARAAGHVVRLHRQDLLERVRCAVRLQR